MKHAIRRFPALWRATRLARRWYYARYDAYPDWQAPLSADSALWESARNAAQGGPRVLMATAIGSYVQAITLESAVAAALTFRGAEVHALLCDGAMTACAECDASLYPDVASSWRVGRVWTCAATAHGQPSACTRSSDSRSIATATG